MATEKPVTIQDKIIYKMEFDRNPAMKIFADKVAVRDFVSTNIGDKFLIDCYGIFNSLSGIDREVFPRNFVVKANHGSGAVVICWEGAPRGVRLPKDITHIYWEKFLIHPDDLVWQDLIPLSDKWMKLNYAHRWDRLEWAYQDIPPQIIVEAVLTHDGNIPSDLKFFMIGGQCKFIQVDAGRFSELRRNLYNPDWTLSDATLGFPPINKEIPSPASLELMLQLSSKLSAEIDFIRIGWYESDQGLKFDEFTNYPGAGSKDVSPREQSIEWAKNWKQSYGPSETTAKAAD